MVANKQQSIVDDDMLLWRQVFHNTTRRHSHQHLHVRASRLLRQRVLCLSSEYSSRSNGRLRPHPRNSFQGTYDIDQLTAAFPPLDTHVILGPTGRSTISFADPIAVRALNTALLVADYGVTPEYNELLPKGALVPPVPGRADYVHHIADMLATTTSLGHVPMGPSITGMDIGTGASCIYPTIATSLYGWKMIASDIIPASIASAQNIVRANNHRNLIDIRLQENRSSIFDGILKEGEVIDFCMCNPPFYTSREAFQAENARKLRGLAKSRANRKGTRSRSLEDRTKYTIKGKTAIATSNNFGGSDSDLWCPGGEVAFVQQIISESKSKQYWDKCLWFTSLVSRKDNSDKIEYSLLASSAKRRRVNNSGAGKKERQVQIVKRISMGAGIKSSTILIWSFLDERERMEWATRRRLENPN